MTSSSPSLLIPKDEYEYDTGSPLKRNIFLYFLFNFAMIIISITLEFFFLFKKVHSEDDRRDVPCIGRRGDLASLDFLTILIIYHLILFCNSVQSIICVVNWKRMSNLQAIFLSVLWDFSAMMVMSLGFVKMWELYCKLQFFIFEIVILCTFAFVPISHLFFCGIIWQRIDRGEIAFRGENEFRGKINEFLLK